MTTWMDRYSKPISPEEQLLYDHLLQLVEHESPIKLIERFRVLFVDGVGYPDPAVSAALDKVTASKFAEQEFKFVLNRCCHILINRWQSRSQLQAEIPELINLFESAPSRPVTEISRARSVRRLRELVSLFVQTEQYLTLRRLSQVLTEGLSANGNEGSRPLGTLIRRYPYLYEHCLLSEDSAHEQQQTVRKVQSAVQRQFEIDLSQYVTYQVRRSQIVCKISSPTAGKIIQPVKNPTLLSDQELISALRQFVGKVEGTNTYRDLAQSFLTHSSHCQSYGSFKDDLYEYIISSVDPEYGKQQFNNQLYTQLKETLPQSDSSPVSDFLLVRTCSQLLNFLVVESPLCPNHFVFIDLITNLGPALTTGLLLKVILLCRKVKPYLERRFSILFNHYESYSRDAVQWLIKALENLNVALSTHFGSVDLSFIH